MVVNSKKDPATEVEEAIRTAGTEVTEINQHSVFKGRCVRCNAVEFEGTCGSTETIEIVEISE